MLGLMELVIILIIGLMGAAGVFAIALIAWRVLGNSSNSPTHVATTAPRNAGGSTPSSAELVASLTQRFCPQCRAPLEAESPQGLCPACLMAGALASEAPDKIDSGFAATTPGGEPLAVAGPIATLQQQFPNLEMLELLGQGGMGSVYKARQKHLDRIVAIKVIPPEAAANPAFAERFAREARALARLNHPNIVTVHDFGEVDGVFYLVMEYVDGLNLRQAMRAGQLAPSEALAIVPPICDALQYAHDQGVVHRDIKPENVLLDRAGRVKIADFGLAKLLGVVAEDFTLTRTQQVMGTPRYMAPEQIETPSSVDHRADIYSLGVVFYEMLTGQLPLGRFDPPSRKAQLDVRIDEVVLRALEREPDRRYQRVSEMKTGLESVASSPGRQAAPPRTMSPAMQHAAWQAPATKDFGSQVPVPPGGVPLGMVLAVALGIVLGILLMTAGLAMGALAFMGSFGGPIGGWLGAAFGCFVGGFGSAAGSYNTYRQLAGAEDLMYSPRVTWLDWVVRGYLVVGVLLMIAACWDFPDGNPSPVTFPELALVGVIVTIQAGFYLIFRFLVSVGKPRDVPRQKPVDPHREAMRRRVAGPAIGLMIVGVLGIVPCLAGIIIAPAATLLQPRQVPSPPPVIQHDTDASVSLGRSPLGTCPAVITVPAQLPPLLAQAASPPEAQWSLILPLLFGVWYLINLAFSITIFIGGWRMRQLNSYGLAMIAASLALLPCTFGWFLGLPMGIWALLVLQNADVREAFEH